MVSFRYTHAEIIEDYPSLKEEHILAALAFAAYNYTLKPAFMLTILAYEFRQKI